MKLKYNFVVNKVADTSVAVPVGSDCAAFGGYIKLNDTGASIFNLLKNEITEDEIVKSLLEEYEDTDEQEVRETVTEFIGNLAKAGIIE